MRIRVGGKVIVWFINEENDIPKLKRIAHAFGKKEIKKE